MAIEQETPPSMQVKNARVPPAGRAAGPGPSAGGASRFWGSALALSLSFAVACEKSPGDPGGPAGASDAGTRGGQVTPSDVEEAARGPVLHIDDPIFDWSMAYRGQQLEHTFTLSNRGTEPLVIESVKSHCGCTVTREDEIQRRLLPGESTGVTIGIDTSLLRGSVRKDTDLITNAPGEHKLWMQGEVEDLLDLEPPLPKVEWVRGSLVPPEPTRISVRSNVEKAIRITGVRPMEGLLAAEVRAVEEGAAYEISLEPALEEETGDAFRTEVLELRTECDATTLLLQVPVSVVLQDRIEVRPSKSVYLHARETASLERPEAPPPHKLLEIGSVAGPAHRFRIEGARSESGSFRTEVETVTPGREFRLKVTLLKRPEDGKRFLKDTIEVSTDDPLVPVLVIPAMAQFSAGGE